jgi:hypothetical protein
MSVYAGQSTKSRHPRPSSARYGLAARSAKRTLVTQPRREPCLAVPAGLFVGNDPASMADRFCPAVLLMPAFGKRVPGHQIIVPCLLGASDDQHASSVGIAGLARISGRNDA